MKLEPFDKLILIMPLDEIRRGVLVGIKPEKNKTTSYMIEPRGEGFKPLKNGARMLRINSRDIGKEIQIKKHKI
jgi:hypothetical protein